MAEPETHSPSIASARCLNHPEREAVVRCPSCGRYFCKECVSEHEDRFLCASCLAQAAETRPRSGRGHRIPLLGTLRLAAAVLLLWLLFLGTGHAILHVPDLFHEEVEYQMVHPTTGEE